MRHLVDFLSGYCSELSERLRIVESRFDISTGLALADTTSFRDEVCSDADGVIDQEVESGVVPDLARGLDVHPGLKRARPLNDGSVCEVGTHKRPKMGTQLHRTRSIKRKHPCVRCQEHGLKCISAPVCTECKQAGAYCHVVRIQSPGYPSPGSARWSFMPGDDAKR